MATTVKMGWLHDKDNNKFAPKTLTSQVQTADGTLIEDKILTEIDNAKMLIAKYNVTTIDELNEAYNTGRSIILIYQRNIYTLVNRTDTVYSFVSVQGGVVKSITNAGDVWSEVSEYNLLQLSGGTMTGELTLNADPTEDLHAVTKQYVDNLIGDVDAAVTEINSILGGTA